MRALEATRLVIRAFTLADAETYSRLLDEAFGAGAYGSSEEKRLMFEYQVVADAGLALLGRRLRRLRAVPHAVRVVAVIPDHGSIQFGDRSLPGALSGASGAWRRD